MNTIKLALKLTCAAAVAWPLLNACGGDDRPGAAPGGRGGSGGTTDGGRRPPRADAGDGSSDVSTDGRGGTGGRPDASDAAVNQPGAPIVTITSPKALATPTADVLSAGEVTVLCTARKASIVGASDVDGSSVSIELLDAAGAQIQESSATPTGTADEYRARFPLVLVPAGRITFRCSARELSSDQLLGSHHIQTFVDHGPRVTPNQPLPDSARWLKTEVLFDFTVEPERLTDSDSAADVERVTFSVDGVPFTPAPVPAQPGKYQVSVNFNDRRKFDEPPTGSVAVAITAKNKRTATGTTREHTYFFVLDGTGPVITILTPRPTEVVGGKISLQFKIEDEYAGNDSSKLQVRVAGEVHKFGVPAGLWSEQNGTFTFLFDSTSVENTDAQVTVNVDAVDTVGNPSTASRVFYLDNQPPIVDLDPPLIRETVVGSSGPECSHRFDPVGELAVSEGQPLPVRRSGLFRALVWERTNPSPEMFHAGLKETSVKLYLYKDVLARPLVVDSDGDDLNVCDEINEEVLDNTSLQQLHQLTPLRPTGDSWFGTERALAPAVPTSCRSRGVARPDQLCTNETSDLMRVIDHTMPGSQPVIFADTPADGATCTGITWEIASWVGRDGWVCLAAMAEDNVGNIGVSEPLRVCLDDGIAANGAPSCPLPPPSCTDTCRAPRFEDVLPGLILPRAD